MVCNLLYGFDFFFFLTARNCFVNIVGLISCRFNINV